MFNKLKEINNKPKPFEFYTTEKLWNDEHISKKMLQYHLDENNCLASRDSKFIDASVNWIADKFHIKPGTKIYELGCGPGLYSCRFADLGAKVTAIDFSQRSIEYAKNKAANNNQDINYITMNYLDYTPAEKFDLVTLIYDDFCTLSPAQRARLLKIIKNCIKEDGAFLLDAASLHYFESVSENSYYGRDIMDGFWSEQEYYGFYNLFKYQNEKIILEKYSIFEKDKTWQIYNWLQCYQTSTLEEEFEKAGFRHFEFFADVCGTPANSGSDELALIAAL